LTLHARLLWTCGLPDQAASTAESAVAAARDAGLASSQARALALAACPIAIWRGEAGHARRQVHALESLARDQGLDRWQSWIAWYRAALERLGMTDCAGSTPLAPATPAAPALADLLATFHPDFGNENPWEFRTEVASGWCAPERMRRIGERLAADGHFEQAQAMLQSAVDMANDQSSVAWALRATFSLARLLAPTNPLRARALLAHALADCKEGQDTIDVRTAKAFAQRLDDAARGSAIRSGHLQGQS